MENTILDIIKYILKKYPHKSDLSSSRLTKILYLADWKSAIDNNKQITDASWNFHHYGPYVDDFMKIARNDKDILIKDTCTMFGGKKHQIELSNSFDEDVNIPEFQKSIIDFVIDKTKNKNYDEFIKLVYSTYPVISSNKYEKLDLVELARQYKKIVSENKDIPLAAHTG